MKGAGVESDEVTLLLAAWHDGDPEALSRLMPLVYSELRRLAARSLDGERRDHTLQPTALVHEAYLRLAGGAVPRWHDRVHFFAVAAQVMRRLLVDHARARRTDKRGGGARRLPLEAALEIGAPGAGDPELLLALDVALDELAEHDARKARIIELRFFGGLTQEETALVVGVATSTVILEARLARAWLYRRMASEEAPRTL
jgi:RNA polymerase sigma factor (TIGR02999 family)